MRALVFHPLRQAVCAMELGAQFVCFIVLEHTGLLACFYSCMYFCLAGTLSHQISAVSISELLLQGTVSDFVSSGAEWSRSLYSFMRRGHTHCIYCDRLAEWFGSLWAYQSSCFSLHQPGRLLSDEYQ